MISLIRLRVISRYRGTRPAARHGSRSRRSVADERAACRSYRSRSIRVLPADERARERGYERARIAPRASTSRALVIRTLFARSASVFSLPSLFFSLLFSLFSPPLPSPRPGIIGKGRIWDLRVFDVSLDIVTRRLSASSSIISSACSLTVAGV